MRTLPAAYATAVIAAVDDAVFSKALDGTITSWNPAAERLYGYTAAQIVGSHVRTLAPPEKHAEIADILVRLARGERIEGLETVRVTRDGRPLHVSVTISPIADAKGRVRGAAVVTRDIGPRLQAQVRDAARRELLEQIPVAVVGLDASGVVRLWNAAATEMLGWTPDQVTGHRARAGLRRLAGDAAVRAEIRLSRNDGSTAVARASGFPVRNLEGDLTGHIVLATDITDLRDTERTLRAQEERLRQSEARFELLFSSSPLPMWVYDLETLEFLEVNDTAVRRYGYTRDEFLAMRLTDIRPPEDVARLRAHLGRKREPLEDAGLWRHRRKDGSVIDVEVTAHAIRFEGRRAAMVVARDVSERLLAQRALEESEARFRALFEQSAVATFMHRDGVALAANAAALAMFGYGDLAEVEGRSVYDRVAPHAREAAIMRAARRTAGFDEPLGYETVGVRRDGSEFPVLLQGARIVLPDGPALLVYVTELTERKKVEAERDRLAAAVEQVADTVLVMDAAGRIVYMNPALERISGQQLGEVTGKPATILTGGLAAPFEPQLQLALSAGRTWTGVVDTRRADGALIKTEITVSPIQDDAGRFAGSVSIGRDVTREQALEEQLRQAQKMEAIGQLAGGIAHDFNNLLTALRGYVELVRNDLPAESPGRSDLDQALLAADRASDLTRQLLAFGRRQVLQPRVVDPAEVVAGIAPMLRRLLGEDVRLHTHMQPGAGNINVDPGQLEQVIVNLAVNARDALPAGGSITIEAANVELDAGYAETHAEVVPGPYVMLAVSDNGVGMDEQTRQRAFEPFFTTKERGKGTGMGLATVYGIVKQSGGSVFLYSEAGQGTTVRIYFPRADEPVATPENRRSAAPLPAGTETILLVEDDASVRAFTRRTLEAQGYHVLEASDGATALLRAGGFERPIDLLVTDVVMPGMHGADLARELQAVRPGLRTLFISGFTENSVIHHGVVAADVAFLPKPFSAGALAQAVRQALDRAD